MNAASCGALNAPRWILAGQVTGVLIGDILQGIAVEKSYKGERTAARGYSNHGPDKKRGQAE